MRNILLVMIFWFLSGCAHGDPWTRQDTILQIGVTAAIACDAYTTTQIQYHEGVYENGPIAKHVLGPQPSTSDTYQFMATVALSNYLVSRALPAKWRPYWQGVNLAQHSYYCGNNVGRMDL